MCVRVPSLPLDSATVCPGGVRHSRPVAIIRWPLAFDVLSLLLVGSAECEQQRTPIGSDLTAQRTPATSSDDVDFPSFNLLSRGSCAYLPVHGSVECHRNSVATSGRRPRLHIRLSGCRHGSGQILSFTHYFHRFSAGCKFSQRSIEPCMTVIMASCALKTSIPKSSMLWLLPRTYHQITSTSKLLTHLDWRSF